MKTKFARAALIACLALSPTAAWMLAPATALAADQQPKGPVVSKDVAKPLMAAQQALTAQKYQDALTALQQANAVSDRSDYDNYLINYFTGVAQHGVGNDAAALTAFAAAADSPALPADQRGNVYRIVMELSGQQKNYQQAITYGQKAIAANASTPDLTGALADAYYESGDNVNAMKYAQQSIDQATAAGQKPSEEALDTKLFAQNKQKDIAGETQTLGLLAQNYGGKDYWGNLIDLTLGQLPAGNKEVAAFYLYRLRLLTNATTAADDYLMASKLAMEMNSPGDAVKALQTGLDTGVLSHAQAASGLAKAKARAKSDEAALPAADRLAAKQAAATGDVSVAEGYYGYGQYAQAETAARRAVGKGGPKLAQAQMVLGAALVGEGKDAEAAQTFQSVQSDPAIAVAAKIWNLYATRKYGTTAAAAH